MWVEGAQESPVLPSRMTWLGWVLIGVFFGLAIARFWLFSAKKIDGGEEEGTP